jgi:hypothetical protein
MRLRPKSVVLALDIVSQIAFVHLQLGKPIPQEPPSILIFGKSNILTARCHKVPETNLAAIGDVEVFSSNVLNHVLLLDRQKWQHRLG